MERYEEGRMEMGRDGESEKQREGGVSPDEQIKRQKEKERRFSGRQRKAAQNEGLLLV